MFQGEGEVAGVIPLPITPQSLRYLDVLNSSSGHKRKEHVQVGQI